MAFADQVFYCNAGNQSTTGHYAVAQFAASTAYTAGQLVRQLTAPAVGSERVFVVIVAGTSSTEPSWTVTRGAKNTSGTVTFQECTGASSLNGDLINTPNWTIQKATGTPTLGAIIKRNNNASYQICSTAGTLGASEPAFSDTAGTTTTEGTTTWTSLGAVGNFTGGQAPFARIASTIAANWFIPGNTIYVANNHAETTSATLNWQPLSGFTNTITKYLCHNHSGSYPPTASDLTTGAVVTVTGGSSLQLIPAANGGFYFNGIKFSGSGAISLGGSLAWMEFDTCAFDMTGAAGFTFGLASGSLTNFVFNNTTLKFASTAEIISVGLCNFIWQNTAPLLASGSLIPSSLFNLTSNNASVVVEACDLSQLTGNLSNPAFTPTGILLVKDCKLNASTGLSNHSSPGFTLQLVRCDSSTASYKSARYAYEGTETTETSITRVGGAADPTGQAQSRKIVTTANSQWLRPFKAEPYAIWNPTTGANVTVTVYGTINSASLPNNDDIWLEVEYLGSASFPIGTMVTTTKATLLSSNAAVASDGSTWNGGGSGAGWSPFKLTTTLSAPQPGLAGYLHARVRVAAPTMTCYIDPLPVLS